jgi:hypothetical protein
VKEDVELSTAEMQALLDKLEDFLDEHPALTRHDKAQARELLSHLNKGLDAEYKRTSTVRGLASLGWREQSYYVPAVHAAYGSLTIRTNSVPGPAWIHDLMSAQIDLDFYAQGLRELLGK